MLRHVFQAAGSEPIGSAVFAYPTFADAAAEWPIVQKLLTRQPLDEPAKDVAHAVYVVTGVGLSHYPGAPETFAAEAYGEADAARDLQAAFGASEGKFGASAGAIPWSLIIPILLQLLQEWFKTK